MKNKKTTNKKVNKEVKEEQAEGSDRKAKSLQKKLINMQMSDGKLYNKKGVKSIDELLGNVASKYGHREIDKYEGYINNLNTSDLQAHATQVGVLPNQDRQILIKRLLKEFKVYNSGYLNTADAIANPFKKKISQETIDILSQGR